MVGIVPLVGDSDCGVPRCEVVVEAKGTELPGMVGIDGIALGKWDWAWVDGSEIAGIEFCGR